MAATMFDDVRWTRIEPGLYTWAGYTVQRVQTTFPIGRRGAVEYRWDVRLEGGTHRLFRRATMAEAKAAAQRHAHRAVTT